MKIISKTMNKIFLWWFSISYVDCFDPVKFSILNQFLTEVKYMKEWDKQKENKWEIRGMGREGGSKKKKEERNLFWCEWKCFWIKWMTKTVGERNLMNGHPLEIRELKRGVFSRSNCSNGRVIFFFSLTHTFSRS